ncbi:MAG TPA: hypothetical protein VJ777_05445 [Mycobacterium sp.]|nr:hypothetical protein [Mycobacterium sp.]
MVSKPIHVKVTTADDALAAIEAVLEDGVPREIERDGEVIAEISPPRSRTSRLEWKPSRDAIEAAKATAGSLKDFPEFADLAERIHRWRRESPPSEPLNP